MANREDTMTARTEVSHTPGPWRVGSLSPREVRTDDLVSICHAITTYDQHGKSIDEAEASANARLIAAAPEMLEALRDIVASAQKAGVAIVDLSRGRAAIAKAEGRP